MGLLLYLIVGGLIGWLAGMILGKDVPMGCIGNIIAGIIAKANMPYFCMISGKQNANMNKPVINKITARSIIIAKRDKFS